VSEFRRTKWPLDVLLAEDTEVEVELYRLAMERAGTVDSFEVVNDGEELIAYLRGKPPFNRNGSPQPNIILLDLKMPRMDGFDALKWLQQHPDCAIIPTIMISNSWHHSDIQRAYELGVNAFFTKPTMLNDLVEMLKLIFDFWSCSKRPDPVTICH
jgi:CheY-like chemotaxis protein